MYSKLWDIVLQQLQAFCLVLLLGHLPVKQQDYRKKYRNLASTYLTFSADGNELLVNLGGEQIYLFDINNKRKPKKFDIQAINFDSLRTFKGKCLA
jgi:hypothetical protein